MHSKNNICIATSGGMDSMALCHFLLSSDIKFSIAHCNFQLRGEESIADELFVKSFAIKYGIPLYIEQYETENLSNLNKTSIEEEARNLRYDFFHRLTIQYNFDALLTAHHLDDQVETILMRLISGSGIGGLQGIPHFREPNYYRPLLHTSRSEIEKYILGNNIEYRIDKSNLDSKYKRNKIRNEILPLIEEINPSYREAFNHASILATEYKAILEVNFERSKVDFMIHHVLDLIPFHDKKYYSTALFYILSDFNPSKIEINQLACSEISTESKRFQCGNEWVEFKNGKLYLIKEHDRDEAIFDTIEDLLATDLLNVSITTESFKSGFIYMDTDKIHFPLILRTPKDGDFIAPIGLNGKTKKLTKLFQEKKWSYVQKKQRCIFEDNLGEIIGILDFTSSISTMISETSTSIIKIARV